MNSNEDKLILASQIKKIRKSLNKTQEEFGELFNPPAAKSIVSRWEKGKSAPNDNRLNELSKISGIPIDELKHGSLKNRILELIDFACSFSIGDYYKYKNKNSLSLTDREFFSHAAFAGAYMDADIFEKRPKIKKNFYLKEVFKRVKSSGHLHNDRNFIMSTIFNVARNHFEDNTSDDAGLLNLVETSISDIYESKIPQLIYVHNVQKDEEVKVANTNPLLEKRIEEILVNTENKISDLYKEFNVEFKW